MSDYNVHAGPVVRCKVSYAPTTTMGCPNKSCSSYGRQHGGKFCNMCAQPYGEVPCQYERETVDYHRVVGEEMHSKKLGEDRIFLPNLHRDDPRKPMTFDPSDEVHMSITAGQIDSEKEWLCTAFGGAIDRLRAAYGADNVTVEWFILSWYL